jgi:hypothetical protein
VWAHLGGGLVGAALVLGGVLTRGVSRPGAEACAVFEGRGFPRAAVAMAGLAAASLAVAWVGGRPWQLVAEPTWARHDLGRVTIEAPVLLGEPMEVPVDIGAAWELGDPLRDPIVLVVEVIPHGLDGERLAQHVLALESDDSGPSPPPDARVRERWHRRPGEGPPTFEVAYDLANELRLAHSVRVFDGVDVQLTSYRWPALGARWAESLQRIDASVATATH